MSGLHFVIECEEDVCRVRDLNSRNGTLLNGERITEASLKDGDKIRAGQSHFVVHIPDAKKPLVPELADTISPEEALLAARERERQASLKSSAPAQPPVSPLSPAPETSGPFKESVRQHEPDQTPAPEQLPLSEPPQMAPQALVADEPAAANPFEIDVRHALDAAAAATPEGRLLLMLRQQREPLFALLDAAREPQVPELLRDSGEEYQSLYEGDAHALIAPYLVRLPPSSRFLDRIVREGWGQGWIVFLNCAGTLESVRDYFRQSLMVKLPDGREFFSRFYDPRFFRNFLRGSTPAEAERFFGPITRYLMEAENPDILLQFTKTARGTEMKERLLLIDRT
jgi:hypothetical protein